MLPLLGLICFYCYHCIFLAAATVCYRALQIASSLVLQYCCSHWQTLYHITGGLGPLDFFSSFEHIQYKRTIYELWRISSQWLVFPSNLHKNVFCGLCPTTTKVLYLDRKRMLDHIYTSMLKCERLVDTDKHKKNILGQPFLYKRKLASFRWISFNFYDSPSTFYTQINVFHTHAMPPKIYSVHQGTAFSSPPLQAVLRPM